MVFVKDKVNFDVAESTKTFSFCTSSPEELQEWVDVLQDVTKALKQQSLQSKLDHQPENEKEETLEEQVVGEEDWMVMPEISQLTNGHGSNATYTVDVTPASKGRVSITCLEVLNEEVVNTWTNSFTIEGLSQRHRQLKDLDSSVTDALPALPTRGFFSRYTINDDSASKIKHYFTKLLEVSDRDFVVDVFFNGELVVDDLIMSLGEYNKQEGETRLKEVLKLLPIHPANPSTA